MARTYQKHGTHALERALNQFGSEGWLKKLGPAGDALREWREGLIEDLGGEPSTAQLAMIDMACPEYLFLERVDRWMLSNKAIVNKLNRRLFDIVLHRNRLADGLAKKLALIGLERRSPPPEEPDGLYLESKRGERASDGD